MELNIIDRLELFMQRMKLNDNQLTVSACLSVGLIGKARKTRNGLHSDSIEKILHTYPILSAEWLLLGRGEMLKNENKGNEGAATDKSYDKLLSMLDDRHNKIEELSRYVGKLEQENESLRDGHHRKMAIAADPSSAYKKTKKTE